MLIPFKSFDQTIISIPFRLLACFSFFLFASSFMNEDTIINRPKCDKHMG